MTAPRLLVVGEGQRPTGYARVMESVLARLDGVDAALFAVNHSHPPAPRRFDVHANRLPGDRYGRAQLPALLRDVAPDVVLVHSDAGAYAIHRDAVEHYGRARVVVYCPVGWDRVVPAVPKSLTGVDRVVVYTRFGERVLRRAFTDAGVRAPPLSVIPHGVDRRVFRPLGTRADARRQLFPDAPELADAFVVLNANRNVRRKRVDLTLRGFAEFARGRPDAYLYLHMGMRDRGCDVRPLAAELGIASRLLTTTREDDHPGVSDDRLNLIYNACDVGLNTCEAEGWGLVAFEHAATGAAQVVPDGSACGELWRDHGMLVPATPTDRGGHLVAAEAVAGALARLYDDRSLLAQMGRRAHDHAGSRAFDWDSIAAAWERTLLD